MAMTVHDILMNADLFRRAYPNWPSAEPAISTEEGSTDDD